MRPAFITDEATQIPGEAVRLAQEVGASSLELRSVLDTHVSELSPAAREEVRCVVADAGLDVCCIDSFVFKCPVDAPIEPQLEQAHRAIDAAAYFGAPLVRIFSFWRTPDRANHASAINDALQRVGELARGSGVRIVIENGKKTMHANGVELAELLAELDQAVFGALWDPGNSIFGGTDADPLAIGFPAVASFVEHVHIKDPQIYRDGSRSYVALGDGALGVRAHVRALRAAGYGGCVSLETHFRPDRRLAEPDLDFPGGSQFSHTGFSATREGMLRLVALVNASEA